ncbi:MAG: hypothetical protein JWR04_1333 [Rhodoglobus sp.]|nr:hypothetical protein [Rhodoglobus sp.]
MSNFDNDISARLKRSLSGAPAPELSTDIVSGAAAHPAPRLGNPARTLRIAGGAGLAVAVVAVGALVVAPTLTRPPLFTAAAASGAPGAQDAVSPATESMKIGWWVDYNYSAGAGLSTDTGSGEVYQLVLDGEPEQRASDIAGLFGVDGSPAKSSYSDPSYPTWVVGPEDGSAPTVSVTWAGTGDWWYSDPAASSVYICDPSVTAEQSVDYGCTLPADAPENLAPSEDEARAQTQSLLASTGFEVDAADITTYSDDWSTTATANLVVGGAKTALDWSITWSNTGEISWAYGHSVTVQSRGSYGTVSAVDAVDRLEDGRWWGSAGPDYQGGGAIAYAADLKTGAADEPTTEQTTAPEAEPTAPAPVDPEATAEPAPTEPVPTEPVPTEPVPTDPVPVDPIPTDAPTPEVVNVTVETAEPTLLLMWDADGGAWLVPGYAMKVADGWWSSVVSLVDGVIALPEPVETEVLVD